MKDIIKDVTVNPRNNSNKSIWRNTWPAENYSTPNYKKIKKKTQWRILKRSRKKKILIEEAPDSYRIIIFIHNKTYVPKEKNYLEQVEVLEYVGH